ncbi:MAG: hypothetical protein SFX72_08855 [Isosphaeraceae bacterium]|nr:hypothetical protein [Isosphaeraceae bacterium]
MSTLLLLVSAVSVWTAFFTSYRRNREYTSRIAISRELSRELEVIDPTRPAVVKLLEEWYDENRWDVHLPEQSRLHLATEGVSAGGLAVPSASAILEPGRRRVELRIEGNESEREMSVLVDGREAIRSRLPDTWNHASGSSGGSQVGSSRQFDRDAPLVLFRRRLHVTNGDRSTTPADGEKAAGAMLWIEPVGGGSTSPPSTSPSR